MIRINLFPKMSAAGSWAERLTGPWGIGAGLAALVLAVVVVVSVKAPGKPSTRQPAANPVAAKTPPEAAVPRPPETAPQIAAPVLMSYGAMPFARRLPYEMLYARNVFKFIGDAIPAAAMPPSEILIDSFVNVRIVGGSTSKQAVADAFRNFKREGVTLLPRPLTNVSATPTGYAFTIAATMQFPLDTRDVLVDSAVQRLPAITGYAPQVKRAESLAAAAHVSIVKGLRYVSALQAKPYRRYVYRMDARATFADFVRFAGDLRTNGISCAFGRIDMKAGKGPQMTISAEMFFAAHE